MNKRDAQVERGVDGGNLRDLSVHEDLAAVGRLHPGEDFHERALSRAVLADEREDLAPAEAEVDLVERPDAGKSLGDLSNLEQGRGGFAFAGHGAYSPPPFPSFAFRSFQKPSTLSLRIWRAGTWMNLFSGMTLLSPPTIALSTTIDW